MSHANNKGADQPHSLISAFVVRCLDSVMSLVSVTKISSLMLASVAEQASLSLTWSETPEDTFSHNEAHMIKTVHMFEFVGNRLQCGRLRVRHTVPRGLSSKPDSLLCLLSRSTATAPSKL